MKPDDVSTVRRVPLIFRYGPTWYAWDGNRLRPYRTWRGALRGACG